MTKKLLSFALLCALVWAPAFPALAEEKTSGSFFHRSRKTQAAKEEAKKEAAALVAVEMKPEKPLEERMVTEGITLPEIKKEKMPEPPPLRPDAFDPDPVPAMPAIPSAPASVPQANKGYLLGAPQAPQIQLPPSIPKVPAAPKPPPSPGKKQY